MISFILDLETLDTAPSAVITEIGILAVDCATREAIDSLTLTPNILAQLALGRTYSKDTIDFHFKEGSAPGGMGTCDIKQCAEIVTGFFKAYQPHQVWIQGPDFDRPILEDFLHQHGHPLPWKFSKTMDSRTLWSLAFPGIRHAKRPHHAIEDCRATLADMLQALTALNRIFPISVL